MSSGSFTQQPQVQSVLHHCRRQIRNNALLAGIASVILVVLSGVLLAVGLDYLLPLPGTARAALLIGLVVAVVLAVYRSLVQPLTIKVTDEQLGAAVDLSAPELQESLATLISIEGPDATNAEAGSVVMRQHLREHVVNRISGAAPSDVVDLSATRKRCGIAGLVFCVAMIPVVVWPSISSLLLNRLIAPFENLSTVSNLYFEVADANRTVARNSDVQIAAVPKWRNETSSDLPESVQVKFTSSDGSADFLPMLYDDAESAYVCVVPAISDSVDFQITAPNVTSQIFHLNVVDRPSIRTAMMIDTPPIYTGRAVQRFDGMFGNMDVFEGSQLEIELTLNKPVTAASIVWLDRDAKTVEADELEEAKHDEMTGEEVIVLDQDPDSEQPPEVIDLAALPVRQNAEISPDGMTARFHFPAEAGGNFEFEVVDEFELTNIVSTSRHLTVTYDLPPELSVGGTQDGQHYRPDDILPLNCLASDDIGLGELQLHYRVGDEAERLVPAADFEAGSLMAQNAFRISLADLGVSDGDIVRVKVKAADERPDPGPQVTWSDSFSITIDSKAAAAGAEGLRAETEGMIAALKQLEQLLLEDEKQGWDLRNKIRNEISDERRTETERLSEKEQQQGRILEQLAEQVATHPLMEESADKLKELSQKLRQDIPDTLNEALENERNEAAHKIEDATKQIQQTRQQLANEIRQIEKMARLEQELAELNRLALQAEQLAEDSDQLEQDRQQQDARPDELSPEEWDAELQDRQNELQQQQQELTSDIEQLLEQQHELRKAAQNAQKEQLMDLAEEVQKLAEQQSTLAQGTQEEAREAGRDSQKIANELERVRRDAEKLNQELDKLDDTPEKTDTTRLQEAVQELRKGNLDESRQDVSDAANDAQKLQQQLNDKRPPKDEATSKPGESQSGESQPADGGNNQSNAAETENASTENDAGSENTASKATEQPDQQQQAKNEAQAKQRQQAADKAHQIEDKLKNIEDQIAALQAEKNLTPSSAADPSPNSPQNSPTDGQDSDSQDSDSQDSDGQAPAADEDAAASQPDAAEPEGSDSSNEGSAIQDLLQQLQDAAESAESLSKATDEDSRANGNARKAARDSAKRTQNATQQAASGRFKEAAQQLAQASSSAGSAGRQMNNEAQQDQRKQAEDLSQSLGRLAENMRNLQQDDASQIAAQQQTQADVAEQAAGLPERLAQLQDTLQLPALQMQKQADKTGEAATSAQQAAETSQQATGNLQQGNLQQASQEGRATAEQLRKVADAARAAGQQGGQQQSPVPNEVGQSVADALQQLQEAAQAMQQTVSEQPGQPSTDGQQPSDPSSESGQEGQQGKPQNGETDSDQQGQPSEQPTDNGKPSPSNSEDGQPAPNGAPQPGTESLSKAANSLAEAAKQSLPGQHRPSDPSNTNSQAASDAGNGSTAFWNGLIPNASGSAAAGRNWGQLMDELDTNTSESMGTTRDPEYEALIRMYFREVAKAAEKGK